MAGPHHSIKRHRQGSRGRFSSKLPSRPLPWLNGKQKNHLAVIWASATSVPRPTEMKSTTDGIRAVWRVKRPQEPGSQGRATSEEQSYPGRLALAQVRVTRPPPPLAAAKHRPSRRKTFGALFTCKRRRAGWEGLSEALWAHQER